MRFRSSTIQTSLDITLGAIAIVLRVRLLAALKTPRDFEPVNYFAREQVQLRTQVHKHDVTHVAAVITF